jgi:hypothetical protein
MRAGCRPLALCVGQRLEIASRRPSRSACVVDPEACLQLHFVISEPSRSSYRWRIRIELNGEPREACGTPGRLVMELLDAILNLFDAVSAAIGIVVVWYTWVAPPRRSLLPPPRPQSDPDELDRFLHNLRAPTPSRTSGDTLA